MHEGKVVSLKGSEIVINEDGKVNSYTLAKDVYVIIGGKQARPEEIQQGQMVSFFADRGPNRVISWIQINKNGADGQELLPEPRRFP